jgi:hypothetical protein
MDWLQSITDLAGKTVVPIIQKSALGTEYVENEQALQAERNRWNSLNGSGPVDPEQAANSPKGLWGLILGQTVDTKTGQITSGKNVPYLLIGGVVLVLGFFFLARNSD